MTRIVIYTGALNYSVCKGIVSLSRRFEGVRFLVLVHSPPNSLRKRIVNQWRGLRRNGWRWIPYMTREAVQRAGDYYGRAPWRSAAPPGSEFTAAALGTRDQVELIRVSNIHAKDSLERARAFQPDLGISLAAPILKPSLFNIPKLGTINLHKGKLPDYRGMPPAFWELHNSEERVGCSVHRIDEGLDTGPVLCEEALSRRPFSTLRGLQLELDEVGIRLVCDAVEQLAHGNATWTPQPPGGRTYRKPSLRKLREVEKRYPIHPVDAWPRRLVKELAFWGYANIARPVPRHVLALCRRQRVVVLLYHRVNDEMRDSLTVGLEQFERQMELVSKRFPVVSVEDLIRNTFPRDTNRPAVAVTFDDGYLDNYENAVPILQRYRIPAAFFVSTDKIGTREGFEHDIRKRGEPVPTMTWEQLAQMAQQGFTIGSHTVTHLDCGKADANRVRWELETSKQALRDKLHIEAPLFAFPFGGRSNISEHARDLVRKVGFRGCFSAYGGFNRGTIDPFNMRRTAINCRFSMRAFQARLEGF